MAWEGRSIKHNGNDSDTLIKETKAKVVIMNIRMRRGKEEGRLGRTEKTEKSVYV